MTTSDKFRLIHECDVKIHLLFSDPLPSSRDPSVPVHLTDFSDQVRYITERDTNTTHTTVERRDPRSTGQTFVRPLPQFQLQETTGKVRTMSCNLRQLKKRF